MTLEQTQQLACSYAEMSLRSIRRAPERLKELRLGYNKELKRWTGQRELYLRTMGSRAEPVAPIPPYLTGDTGTTTGQCLHENPTESSSRYLAGGDR
jgi:hypothetical protein